MEYKNGKAELAKRPSLKIQCWNATRWLGRSACLNSLCRAYPYILTHLSQFTKSKDESTDKKSAAKDLYERLTSYETFLFIFFYKDLASMMAKTSKQLQDRDIGISDVGSRIMNLCNRLKTFYFEQSSIPTAFIDEGAADSVLADLFGSNWLEGILLNCIGPS